MKKASKSAGFERNYHAKKGQYDPPYIAWGARPETISPLPPYKYMKGRELLFYLTNEK